MAIAQSRVERSRGKKKYSAGSIVSLKLSLGLNVNSQLEKDVVKKTFFLT